MLRISWKEHKSNDEVLYMMKTSLKLMKIIKKRKCEYFGYIIRRPNNIQRLLLEARNDGKRGRGRPRTMWMDNIKGWLNLSYKDSKSDLKSTDPYTMTTSINSKCLHSCTKATDAHSRLTNAKAKAANTYFKPFRIYSK